MTESFAVEPKTFPYRHNLPLSGDVASCNDDGEGIPPRRCFHRKPAWQLLLSSTTPPVKMG